MPDMPAIPGSRLKACAWTVLDITLFGRVFMVNPALWLGEWLFHASFLLVLLRHLRFFLNPVPGWVWSLQTPGLIAGYFLPMPMIYILIIRLLTKNEKFSSRTNMFLLVLITAISLIGLAMYIAFKPDLVGAKLFILGILSFAPQPMPQSLLFLTHFILVLVLVLLLPSHIFTAPIVMYEARKRDQALRGVMHDLEKSS
jgi:nitrate reductase gamma subunit